MSARQTATECATAWETMPWGYLLRQTLVVYLGSIGSLRATSKIHYRPTLRTSPLLALTFSEAKLPIMYFFSTSVLVAGLVGLAQAQVPSGFTPQATAKLEVMFNTTVFETAGQQLAKACKLIDLNQSRTYF